LKVYYAHGGGYTELGGMKSFLLKINGEVLYEKVFPAVASKPKKKLYRFDGNSKVKIKIKPEESGVTGKGRKGLFKELLRRLEKKNLDGEEVSVLVVIDDTDCRLSNEVARKRFLNSVEEFKRRATEIYNNLKIIFIWAEPEIEKWFCVDIANCFPRNRPCGNKDLHRKLADLFEKYTYEYDVSKDSCKEKFSKRFASILEECKVFKRYNKNGDGSLYLAKVDPFVIEKRDEFAAEGIRQLKNLKNGGENG